MEHLRTFEEVVRALGGTTAVARCTGRTKNAVCNWRRKRGRFPTTLYFIMQRALLDRGYTAPRSLWGFVARETPGGDTDSVAA